MSTIIEITLLVVIFLNILLGVFVLTQNPRSISNRLFSVLSFFGALWTCAHYMISVSMSAYWFLGIFALGSLVISTGLIWTIVITNKRIEKQYAATIAFISIFFFIASLQSGFIIQLPETNNLLETSTLTYGWGLYLFSVYYLFFAFLIIRKLYVAQKTFSNQIEKSQFRLILIGAIITLSASGSTTFIFPLHPVSLSGVIDSVGFLTFLFFISYTITKHQLFSIRIITLELMTLGLWITILIRLLLAETMQERLIEAGLLAITIVFGITLIRSTLHVIKQRDHIEEMTNELQEAYRSLKNLRELSEQKFTKF